MAAVLTLVLQLSGALSSAELLVRDAMLRKLPSRPATRVAVVLIDDEALRWVGHWPWERAQLAGLVEKVFSAGAKGVVIDLLLPEEREGDKLLASALDQGPSVLAAGLDEAGNWVLPNRILQSTSVGHVSFDLDRDGVVRRFSSTKQMGERVLPALPVAAARLRDSQLPIPVGLMLRPAFRTRPIPVVSAASILEGHRVEILRDRIVFLGTSAAGVGDRFVSPVSNGGSPEPGVMIEAISTEAILSKDLLHATSPLINALLAFGLGTLLLTARGRTISLFTPGIALAPLVAAAASLHFLSLELAPLAMLLALLLAGAFAGVERSRRTKLAMSEAGHRISELESLQKTLLEAGRLDAESRRVVAHELKTPLTSVKGLAWLVEHSRRTLAVIQQNIRFALAVKAVFVVLTLMGHASLWSAIAADMGGSLLVLINGLRLLRS